ncbi:MAG: ATP-binding protein [Acidobacteria bacterium]|nr:MAG: ATP-binding protein [Acidobacteriota bacterium]
MVARRSSPITAPLAVGRRHVHLRVEDEGTGIDPSDLSRVFDKFHRGSRGNQENVRGTGLGLALVKAVMEAHGGRVEAESEAGPVSAQAPARGTHNDSSVNDKRSRL